MPALAPTMNPRHISAESRTLTWPFLLERSLEQPRVPRAIGFVPRTLEILDHLQVSTQLLTDGVHHRHMHTYQDGVRIKTGEPYSAPTSRYGSFLSYSCGDACVSFLQQLSNIGVEVEFGLELVDIDAGPQGILAVLRDVKKGRDLLINAKYLIGADGARSFTRKKCGEFENLIILVIIPFLVLIGTPLGFVFEGTSEDIPSMSMDAFVETDFPDINSMNFVRNQSGTLFVCAKPNGAIRFSGERKSLEDPSGNGEFSADATLENIKSIMHPYKITFKELEWFGVWNDAAHVHTPAGGLGMNSGIADAYNVGWKIYLDSQGLAKPCLLDTYDAERRGIAEQAIRISGSLVRLYSATPIKHGSPGLNSTVAKELASIMARNGLNFTGMLEYNPNPLNLRDSDRTLAFCSEFAILAGTRAPDAVLRRLRKPADDKTTWLLNELPAPGVFTILVYVGMLLTETVQQLDAAQRHIASAESFLHRFKVSRREGLFHFATVVHEEAISVAKEALTKTKFLTRSVYIDVEGQFKERFGVPAERASVFVIRPDGYVGACLYLEDFSFVEEYFDGFLVEKRV
ncbi:hypothetical protein BC936DRAFT_148255 [Jimgerdemannia flammicorona]|uniref:FAD binding domain-containing protein n=1 Tax=Jimgerdemannia flammicorona TaxID=994334 RepID=A0A433D3E9_9FUNG|nr:hypothetical protein BC936DRAFT_148255 [Jimgerdemannia flammicorona]